MGDQVGSAIPGNVNYAKQKRVAVSAYSRRVKSLSNNAQNYGESQYCKITLDTATPGSNLDPLQSYLKLDLTITNTNPFIDYVSFGSCGAAGIIDEFRIYSQGTPIEEILQYGTMYELFMDLSGHCSKPYHMFRSSKVSQQVKENFAVNAIKPPMVSQTGDPMYYQAVFPQFTNNSTCWVLDSNTNQPYLLSSQAAGCSFHTFIYTTGAVQGVGDDQYMDHTGNLTTGTAKYVQNNSVNYVPVTINAANIQTGSGTLVSNTFSTPLNSLYLAPAFDLAALILGRLPPTNSPAQLPSSVPSSYGAYYSTPSGQLSSTDVASANVRQAGGSNPNATNCIRGCPPAWMTDNTDGTISQVLGIPPAATLFGSTSYFFSKYSDTLPTNPLNWPFVMLNDGFKDPDVPTLSLQSYFMTLYNVKEIPIGIVGNSRGSANDITSYTDGTTVQTNLNFSNAAVLSTSQSSRSTTVTVCIPLISGILGSMASKAYPTMLAAPGSNIIEIKTAPASKVFQVTMDPCKRVLGTIRDYIAFGGSIGGKFGQFNYLNAFGEVQSDAYPDVVNKTQTGYLNSLLSGLVYLKNKASPGGSSNTTSVEVGVPMMSTGKFGIGSGAVSMQSNAAPDVFTATKPAFTSEGNQVCLSVTERPTVGSFQACLGGNLLPLQLYISSTNSTSLFDLIFSPYSVAAMEGSWTLYDKLFEKIQTIQNLEVPTGDINPVATNQTAGFPTLTTSIPQKTAASVNMYGPPGLYEIISPGIGQGSVANNLLSASSMTQPYTTHGSGPQLLTLISGTDPVPNNLNGAATQPGISSFTQASLFVANSPAAFTTVNSGGTHVNYGSYQSGTSFDAASGLTIIHNSDCSAHFSGSGQTDPVVPGAPTPLTVSNLMEVTVAGHPSGVPLPQYILVKTPWNKKAFYPGYLSATKTYAIWGEDITLSDLCSETVACYGTYLPSSVAQSLRCFNQVGGSTSYVNYSISNIEFVSQQIILPDPVTAELLSIASQGEGIQIGTTSVRMYQSPVNSSTSQNLIIPAKIASANALYVVFQPQNYQSTTEGQLYNSQSRFCPFSQITSSDTNVLRSATQATSVTSLYSFNAAGASGPYALGQSTPFNIKNCPASSSISSFQIQLINGNELIPQQPITSISELVAELTKSQHALFDMEKDTDVPFNLIANSGFSNASTSTNINTYISADISSSSGTNAYYYPALDKRSFCSAFTFPAWLDDQTYINNPNWNYVGACMYPLTAGWTGTTNYYNSNNSTISCNSLKGSSGTTSLLYGARGPYVLPLFMPTESTFVIGFDLDTWSGVSDVARSGIYLGNQTLQLRIQGATALDYNSSGSITTGLTGINMFTYIVHDLRLSFQAGGSIIAFY